MEQEQAHHEPMESTGPVAPPTQPGELSVTARQPVWPNVVGVIAIVLASLAILGGVWELVSRYFLGNMMGLFGNVQMRDVMDQLWSWVAIYTALLAVLGFQLLYGGIMLVRCPVYG